MYRMYFCAGYTRGGDHVRPTGDGVYVVELEVEEERLSGKQD